MAGKFKYYNDNTKKWEMIDAEAITDGFERIDVKDIKALEHSELSSVASGFNGEVYQKVEWKDKSGILYATSTISDDILTVKYNKDNKTIKWKLIFDEDGFPYKKELV